MASEELESTPRYPPSALRWARNGANGANKRAFSAQLT